jgi:hypothetical protein
MADGLVEVKVMLPAERLAGFYELLGRFLGSETFEFEPATSMAEPPIHSRNWTRERLHQWTESAHPKMLNLNARLYLACLTPKARDFLLYLLKQKRFEAPAEEVVAALGLESTRALAGTLSTFGSVAKKTDLLQPFEFRTDPNLGTVYFIHPEIAKVLQQAFINRLEDQVKQEEELLAREQTAPEKRNEKLLRAIYGDKAFDETDAGMQIQTDEKVLDESDEPRTTNDTAR